jgi:hypothetical protein
LRVIYHRQLLAWILIHLQLSKWNQDHRWKYTKQDWQVRHFFQVWRSPKLFLREDSSFFSELRLVLFQFQFLLILFLVLVENYKNNMHPKINLQIIQLQQKLQI